jgi:hypothetical protein
MGNKYDDEEKHELVRLFISFALLLFFIFGTKCWRASLP